MPAPKVSVIIPAYNQALYLDASIQSVRAQTFHDYEIVIVNDGSTDDTASIAQQYGDGVRYLYQENRGLAGARNTGICEARGELVALLDADDLWLPNYLEKMAALADQYPQGAVFYCAARCMDQEGRDLSQSVGYFPIEPADLYRKTLRSNFIIPSTVTMRRSVILQAGYFDQSLRSCEDWDMWLRLLPGGHAFYGIPDMLVRYRIHNSSLSADVSKMQSSTRAVIEKHFGKDDGQYDAWSEDKRIAYGGVYRYEILTSIQRQNNWQGAAERLMKAIQADPALSSDLSFYYELALGSQPIGHRGADGQKLDLPANAKSIQTLLDDLFAGPGDAAVQSLRGRIYGTAYRAIGLAAYNTGQFSLCRKAFRKAVQYQPELLVQKWLVGRYLKSFLGNAGRSIIRKLGRR